MQVDRIFRGGEYFYLCSTVFTVYTLLLPLLIKVTSYAMIFLAHRTGLVILISLHKLLGIWRYIVICIQC